MRFWFREVAGWGLVLFGLIVFCQCYSFLNRTVVARDANGTERVEFRPGYMEAGSWSIVGIFLFRGGIHLLKVAVAARVCMEANERLLHETPARPSPRRVSGPAATVSRPPWGP
jgi:hypothetical protein